MKTDPTPIARRWLLPALAAAFVVLQGSFVAGGTAYTKRLETPLLSEPRPLAPAAGKVGYSRPVKIEKLQDNWLLVSDGPARGWVFAGNLTDTKPESGKGLDGLPLSASRTTAAAAARPLTPAGDEYAQRHNLASARDDLNWLLQQSRALTEDEVTAYLQAQKRGEYR
jgi:hypothetical protein